MTQIELDHSADWDLYEDEDSERDLIEKGLAHVAEPESLLLSALGPVSRVRVRTRLGNLLVAAMWDLEDVVAFDISDFGVGVEVSIENDHGDVEKVCGWVGWDRVASGKGNPLSDEAERLIAYLETIRPAWSDAGEEIPF